MSFVVGLSDVPLFVDGCLTKEAIWTFMDCLLTNEEMDIVIDHINRCDSCNQLFTTISTTSIGISVMVDDLFHREPLSQYRIVRTLDDAGRVFEVTSPSYNEHLVLKILSFEDGEHRSRFTHAFHRFRAISFPNLVRLYDFYEHPPQCSFTMELVNGEDIVTFTKQAKSDLSFLLNQLCMGITRLHRAGIVHRNIKPSNILVTPKKRVVLLDFGMAVETVPKSDSPPDRFSTVAYMAPEQTAGHAASTASDWYGVGVVLYECLTGHVPFDSATGPLIYDKLENDPEPPTITDSALYPLADLCMKLIARAPAERPTGYEVLRFLESILKI